MNIGTIPATANMTARPIFDRCIVSVVSFYLVRKKVSMKWGPKVPSQGFLESKDLDCPKDAMRMGGFLNHLIIQVNMQKII